MRNKADKANPAKQRTRIDEPVMWSGTSAAHKVSIPIELNKK